MASKSVVHHVDKPLNADRVQSILERARKACPKMRDPFPLDVELSGTYRQASLPPLTDAQGVEPVRWLQVSAELGELQATRAILAHMTNRVQLILADKDHFYLGRDIWLEVAPGGQRRPLVPVSLHLQGGEFYLSFNTGGIMFPPAQTSPQERTRYFAEERHRRSDLFARFFQATRLPVMIVSEARSFTFRHTAGGQVDCDKPAEYGHLAASFTVPGASAEDLLERLDAAIAAFGGPAAPIFSCWLRVPAAGRSPDPCRRVYEHVCKAGWPARSWDLRTFLRVASVATLDGLRPCLPTPRTSLKLTLGSLPLPPQPKQRAGRATLLLATRQDGHHLSLRLSATHATEVPRLGRKLGVTFQP